MNRVEATARLRHLCWCAYQMGAGQEYNVTPTKDQLDSLINAVTMMRSDLTPEQNHENWMRMKKSQGWIYGEVKDMDEKTHPDMVPYAELPEIERRKDDMDILVGRTIAWILDEILGR